MLFIGVIRVLMQRTNILSGYKLLHKDEDTINLIGGEVLDYACHELEEYLKRREIISEILNIKSHPCTIY